MAIKMSGRIGPTLWVRTRGCSLLIMCFVANHDKASDNPWRPC